MIKLCKINRLVISEISEHGIYLKEPPDSVQDFVSEDDISVVPENGRILMPGKYINPDMKQGDILDVYVSLDSEDRPIAVKKEPDIELGRMAVLTVKAVSEIGAFLDWGLDKDLFLPFKEQVTPLEYSPIGETNADSTDNKEKNNKEKKKDKLLKAGDRVPVVLYIDKSKRPAATMRVYRYLTSGGDYVKDSAVEGTVIQINPDIGVYIAIDDKYFGMIPKRELNQKICIGEKVYGRVSAVRADGKYDISLNQKKHIRMGDDASFILQKIKEAGGTLPVGDKSETSDIMKICAMSKSAFKRAVGSLYKSGKVIPGDYKTLLNDEK